MATNPYAHLARKVRGLLMTEAKLSANERQANEWLLLVKFCGTKLTVGKGHVNTMFYQIGEQERRVGYPDQVLDKLEQFAKQRWWRYVVRDRAGEVVRHFMTEAAAMKYVPKIKEVLYGMEGDTETPIMMAKTDVSGTKWIKHKK